MTANPKIREANYDTYTRVFTGIHDLPTSLTDKIPQELQTSFKEGYDLIKCLFYKRWIKI